ncbi:hypothetical protein HAX54_052506 [Datura stramonium]|uniref:Uncharacterized protein n=1 Tax=Datura stramonium TaxID=4076 RepID=A0ABS8WSB3_DATST|nr:hypothetical protein [Datura stramonium]
MVSAAFIAIVKEPVANTKCRWTRHRKREEGICDREGQSGVAWVLLMSSVPLSFGLSGFDASPNLFEQLRKGDIFVAQYGVEFTRLSCYEVEILTYDGERFKKFVDGLALPHCDALATKVQTSSYSNILDIVMRRDAYYL